MQSNNVRIASLNVNGLNNVIKRGKVMAKIRKEKIQVIDLQETHLTEQEHDKLRKFGFKNTLFSSFKKGPKRGVAILISNSVNFELIKEINDKEGRYVIAKGKLDNHLVTLVNVYVPPNSDRTFLKLLFEIIAQENEGILICHIQHDSEY